MKKLAIVFILSALFGCAISDEEIQKAKNACAPFGGLKHITTDLSASCNDGTYIKTMGETTRTMNQGAELTNREVAK